MSSDSHTAAPLVFAVFDALPRTFGVANPERVALEIATVLLRQEAGRALDPDLVASFLDLLPTLGDWQRQAAVPVPVAVPRPLRPAGFHSVPGKSAFENIARAHQEIYALYEIAQAIGSKLDVADTMALIAGKLSPLAGRWANRNASAESQISAPDATRVNTPLTKPAPPASPFVPTSRVSHGEGASTVGVTLTESELALSPPVVNCAETT